MKKYIEITKDCAICAAVLIGIISAVCGVVTFPLVMMNAMGSAWWLIGYLGYVAIGYVLYAIFLKP